MLKNSLQYCILSSTTISSQTLPLTHKKLKFYTHKASILKLYFKTSCLFCAMFILLLLKFLCDFSSKLFLSWNNLLLYILLQLVAKTLWACRQKSHNMLIVRFNLNNNLQSWFLEFFFSVQILLAPRIKRISPYFLMLKHTVLQEKPTSMTELPPPSPPIIIWLKNSP